MLGKLMKYEIKATARWFLPFYAALIIISILNRLLLQNTNLENNSITFSGIITTLSLMVFILLVVGLMAVTLIVSIIRFYKSLLGDEGYLMFTLPVKTWMHIVNKLLIAMLWSVLSSLCAILSIIVLIPTTELQGIDKAFAELEMFFGKTGYITLPVMIIVTIALSILQVYAAIALGHQFNKYKLLASFGMYLAINTICQFVSMLVLPAFGLVFLQNGTVQSVPVQTNVFFLFITALSAAFGVGCFILTHQLLKRKLNLE